MATILVIDDDDDIRASVADLLVDEGYTVHTACEGREAFARLAEIGRPSVVLLDMVMPGMDGDDFVTRLRDDAALGDLPIVVMSAGSSVEAPPGTVMLRKPLHIGELLSTLARLARG